MLFRASLIGSLPLGYPPLPVSWRKHSHPLTLIWIRLRLLLSLRVPLSKKPGFPQYPQDID